MAGDNVLDFSLGAFLEFFEQVDGSAIMRYFERTPRGCATAASSN